MSDKPQCYDCKFWAFDKQAAENDIGSECRAHPPTIIAPAWNEEVMEVAWCATYWPCTMADDWCGEFKPKS